MAFNLEEMRRKGELPIQKKELLNIFKTQPRRIIEDKELFVKFCEAFVYISHREGVGIDAKAPIKFNLAQHTILNVYFDMKKAGLPVRCIGLKGRQMGFSTCVEIIGFVDTICKGGQNMIIATEDKSKSGYNIYEMFYLMLSKFPLPLPTSHVQDGERIQFGDAMGRGMINISGETDSTSYTYKFIHLSEAAFFNGLNKFLNMLLQTVLNTDKETCVFLETTANRFGDEFHDRWQRATEGKSRYKALFIPWFVYEGYQMPFIDDKERADFEKSMGTPEMIDLYGEETRLLSTPAYEVKVSETETVNCTVTLEHLKWRRVTISDECGGSISEFHRQYPTTAEEAFITANINPIDPRALAEYRQSIINGLKIGQIKPVVYEFVPKESEIGGFQIVETSQGVVTIWEAFNPYAEYLMASDHAQGLDSGDYSVAYLVSRNPKRIVAKIRGFDGRRLDHDEMAYQMYGLFHRYESWVCPENNADGGTVINILRRMGCNKLVNESLITGKKSVRYGWMNTGGNEGTRKRGFALLQKAIRDKEWHIPDMMLIDEMRTLIYNNGKIEAVRKGEPRPPGSTALGYFDDCVLAFIGCLLADDALPPARPPRMQFEEEQREREAMFYQQSMEDPHATPFSRGWA